MPTVKLREQRTLTRQMRPRHKPVQSQDKSTVLDWIRNGYQFPSRRGAESRLASPQT